jgi:predicted ArsR family transcriptional regulator/TusA-related sulfurtransferase
LPVWGVGGYNRQGKPRHEEAMSALTPVLSERREAQPSVSVAHALGSSTRADIYEHLRSVGGPCTVRDVAGVFDLHPNVARTHLELLADAGLVSVDRRKHPGGGRPAKIYTARDEPAGPPRRAEPADAATPLLVRLLVTLAEERPIAAPASRTGTSALTVQAHELAVAEGRRLVTAVSREHGSQPAEPADIEGAAGLALRGLAAIAPGGRVVHAGSDWVDVAGVAGLFGILRESRPALADALERGLLSGALAAAGVAASVVEGGAAPGGEPLLRARAVPVSPSRSAVEPAETVDARGGQREAGVVHAMRAVTGLHPGDVLEVLAEGPGSPAAFARWADRAGHELLGVERATDPTGRPAIRLLIRKGR